MRIVTFGVLPLAVLSGLGFCGKDEEGGKKNKHGGYGVGYVEEGGVVGYSCHEGWIQQGDGPNMTCIRKDEIPLLPRCPAGILEGEMCVIREPALFSCPPGYIEVGEGGGHKDKHGGAGRHGGGGKKKKHQGGLYGGLCMKIERAPFVPYCPGGSELASGECIRMEISPATMICPIGDLGGGKKHNGGGHEGKKHEGGKKHSYVPPACVETVDVPPIMTCPPMLSLNGTMCTGTGEGPCPAAPPTPLLLDSGKKHHHDGYRRLGEEEEEEASIDADGRRLGEKDKKHHGAPYPAPALAPVPTKMKMCTLQVIEPAIPVCPPGSFEGGLGHRGGKKQKHKHEQGGYGLMCAQTLDIPLEPYCPAPAATLDPQTMTCKSRIVDAGLTRCPPGFEACSQPGGGKKDKHGGKHGGSGYGPGGCCSIQYADPLPGCPLSSQLAGNMCLLAHAPLFECPPGSIQNEDLCYIIQTKPPKIHYQINVTTKQAAPVLEPYSHKHKKHH